MRTIDAVLRSGVGLEADRTLRDAAILMESSGVGCLAVLDKGRLVGIVTDRDLVRRGLARDLPADARVDAVMSTPVLTVEAEADLDEAFTLLRHNMVRRLAVVSRGEFKGTVAIDDLMVHVANDLTSLVRPVVAEMMWAHRDSRAPATT